MGVVYRARHRDDGSIVAVKSVRVPSAAMLAGIRREILALLHIRHPGIVRVLAEGVEDGLPWFAMELHEGRDLRSFVASLRGWGAKDDGMRPTVRIGEDRDATRKLRGRPVQEGRTPVKIAPLSPPWPRHALEQMLSAMARLCAPLAFLHGEGIVHRDLKPENVLVREGDLPLLVDFGLVARFGGEVHRETIESALETEGTVQYMAPEQIQGRLLDARADLYALGCILFELLTGAPPFAGVDPLAVVFRHLHEEPVPPSAWVQGLPPALDDLVLGLLKKDPNERIGHADVVAARLHELGARMPEAAGSPRPRPFLYRPALVGREEVVDRLEAAAEALAGRRGGMLLFAGESGVGKTRLLLEAASIAASRGLCVLSGECSMPVSATDSPPLQAFRLPLRAIADRCRERGESDIEHVVGRRGTILERLEPAFASLPRVPSHPTPPDLSADAERLRLLTYVADTLLAYAEGTSVLLLLDDLQWADDLTIELLALLLRGRTLSGAPLLVLGAYRSDEVSEGLRSFLDLSKVDVLSVKRLATAAVMRMVAGMLAVDPVPEAALDLCVRHGEGNPFLVAEWLRGGVEEGLLSRDAAGRWQVAHASSDRREPPRTVRALVTRRLQSLGRGARRVARAAAVLGSEMEEPCLLATAGGDERAALRAVAELLDRQVLEEKAPGLLRFAQDTVRAVALESVRPSRLPELHRRAAEALEMFATASRAPDRVARLAWHWRMAGEIDRARGLYLEAAAATLGKLSNVEAERCLRAALDLSPRPSPAAVPILLDLCQALRYQGRNAECERVAAECADEALALEDALGEARALARQANAIFLLGRMEEAKEMACRVLAEFQDMDAREDQARVLADLGSLYQIGGDAAAADDCFERALSIARSLGLGGTEATILANVSSLRHQQGDVQAALDLNEQALAIMRAGGDRQSEVVTLTNQAVVHRARGEVDEAVALYERSLSVAREIGDRRHEGACLSHLAVMLGDQGRIEESLRRHDEAFQIHRETGNLRFQVATLSSIASLLREQGEIERSLAACRDGLELNRSMKDKVLEGVLRGSLGLDLMLFGNPEEGRIELLEALRIHRAARSKSHEAADLCHLARFQRLVEGDLAAAARSLDEAEKALQTSGDCMERLWLACGRGHVALARREPALLHLCEAQRLACLFRVGQRSPAGAHLERLERSVAAAVTGEPLLRGEHLASIPQPLLVWLEAAGVTTRTTPGESAP